MKIIAILCAHQKSNYYSIPFLDIYNEKRNAASFNLDLPVIAHPPCAQWSKLKRFAHFNQEHIDIALHCVEMVRRNGGILEHPEGSTLFKHCGITQHIYSVDQSWFGYPAKKTTWLWFNGYKPAAIPLMFEARTNRLARLSHPARSITTLAFNQWLVNSIRGTEARESESELLKSVTGMHQQKVANHAPH